MLPETPPTASPSGRRRRHPSRQNVRRPGLVLQSLRRSFIDEKLNPEPFLGSLLRCRSHECASRLGSHPGASACHICLLDGIFHRVGSSPFVGDSRRGGVVRRVSRTPDDSSDPHVRAATPIRRQPTGLFWGITTTQLSTAGFGFKRCFATAWRPRGLMFQ